MGFFRKKKEKDEEAPPAEPVVTTLDQVTLIVESAIRTHGGESLPRISEIITSELASAKLLNEEDTNA